MDFQCVAARVETAAAAWFAPARCGRRCWRRAAVPGLFEPVEIDGSHHYDGGLVSSIPLSRAIAAGAGTVYVLQVGRIERALTAPSNPLQVAQVSFEIARRHGFTTMMDSLPDGVDVHVLPSGGAAPSPEDLRGNLSYRDTSGVPATIERARIASAAYLADRGIGADGGAGFGGRGLRWGAGSAGRGFGGRHPSRDPCRAGTRARSGALGAICRSTACAGVP